MSGKYNKKSATVIPFTRQIKLFDIPVSAGTGQFLDSDAYELIDIGSEVPDSADFGLGAKLKIAKCKAIRDWFFTNQFADFGDVITNFFMSRRLPKEFVEDKNVQKKVV